MRPSRASSTSIAGGDFLAGLPPGLESALRAAVGDDFRVTRIWSGGGSECALLSFEGGRQLVLKQARPGSPFEYESEVLARFAGSDIAGLLPRPVVLFPVERAMLLEFAGDADIRAALRSGVEWRSLAAEVAAALASYHRETGCAFGDFHPANVLIDDASVRFIDPAPPDWHGASAGESPAVTDLALWTYSTTANLLWDVRRSPRLAWKTLRLNVELLRLALAGAGPEAYVALRPQVTRHLGGLWRGWPRDKAVFLLAFPLAHAVLFAGRRGSNPRSASQHPVEMIRQPQPQRDDSQRDRSGAGSRHH